METYKAFISYRKSRAENAELVKTSLIQKHGFTPDEIFLDKHNIGPEYYDSKLEEAVELSSSLIIIVTKDCFIPKEEGDDWFLEEIQTALDNDITIIPVLFDGIKSLETSKIKAELIKTFDEEEIEKLNKTQAIRYDFDLSDATFSKLASFIEKADKPDTPTKIARISKSIFSTIGIIAAIFAFFVGVGFIWGYFTSKTDPKDVLIENTHIDGHSAVFEFGGLNARYDLDLDTVFIDLHGFKGEAPQSNLEMFAHSCSVSGAILLFKQNLKAFKYLKFLRGNSKPSRIAMAGATVAICLGSFCGFSQGCKCARTFNQQNVAMVLFPKLKEKRVWRPVFEDNRFLLMMYNKNQNKNINLCTFQDTKKKQKASETE